MNLRRATDLDRESSQYELQVFNKCVAKLHLHLRLTALYVHRVNPWFRKILHLKLLDLK